MDLLVALDPFIAFDLLDYWYLLLPLVIGGIQVPPDSTGKIVETITLTDHRQVIITGGPGAIAEQQAVKNIAQQEGATASYGAIVRDIFRRFGETLTTTALGISGVFTQVSRDGNEDGVCYVVGVARADVASAALGFVLEEYDGDDDDFTDANFVRTVASIAVSANTTTYLHGVVHGRKWRLKYTNGGTGQVTFKLTAAATSLPLHTVDAAGKAVVVSPTAADFNATLGASTANIGDVDVLTVPSPLSTTGGGTEATAHRVTIANDSTGLLSVDDNGGTLTVDAPVGTPVAVRVSDGAAFVDVRAGDVAHDAVDSGNPAKIGGNAQTDEPTAVAIGDRVNAWFDTFGRLVVLEGHGDPEPPTQNNGSAAGVVMIAAPGAGVSLHICKGSVHNAAATEAVVSLREGAAGTIRWSANLAADGGGSLFDFGSRGWKLPANTALIFDAVSLTQYCNITEYYIAP